MAPIFTGVARGFVGFAFGSATTGTTITASGGVVLTPGNGYRYHYITADSQDFHVTGISDSHPGNVEYFLVAGGGSGGGEYSTPNQVCGGGGGAGGVLTGTTPVSVQTYTIGIGTGGVAPAQGRNGGNQGGNSTAFGLTAYGGGGGGHYNNAGADPGGSGGGTGRRSSTDISYGYNPTTPTAVLTAVPLPAPYTLTQGYPGGVAGGTSTDGGGGGGGAGGAGSAGGTGDGGVGVAAFSGDTAVPTDYGDTGPSAGRWFAGGGGGGINGGGAGGAGGGADAPGEAGLTDSQDGAAGATNTGGGGSGGRSGSGPAPSAAGGAGGPGICILKYEYVEGSTPSPNPFSASGGTTYTPGNGYKYHVFKHPNSDDFEVTGGPATVEVLVVAGGGGAGNGAYGGGGGGGGVIYDTAFPISTATYPVTVGDGGTNPNPQNDAIGVSGGDSYFGPPTASEGLTGKGGGGGGLYPSLQAADGGSGGGDGSPYPTGPVTTGGSATQPTVTAPPTATNYGNPGGGPAAAGALSSAGGGGAGAAGGVNPGPDIGGQGGDGQPFPGFEYPLIGLSPLTPHSPTNNHYGGGGSGWGYSAGAQGPDGARGGYGGGGAGASYPRGTNATPGVDHLGGGGAGDYPTDPGGTDGGSGIVIVRYQV
jgi:hypothetical protein